MYKIINKFTGKEYGTSTSFFIACALAKNHKELIVCDMNVTKEERKEKVNSLWYQLNESRGTKEADKIRKEWLKADEEYLALYDEEY